MRFQPHSAHLVSTRAFKNQHGPMHSKIDRRHSTPTSTSNRRRILENDRITIQHRSTFRRFSSANFISPRDSNAWRLVIAYTAFVRKRAMTDDMHISLRQPESRQQPSPFSTTSVGQPTTVNSAPQRSPYSHLAIPSCHGTSSTTYGPPGTSAIHERAL